MGNHYFSPNVTFEDARKKLIKSDQWVVTDTPEDHGLLANHVDGGRVALYYMTTPKEKATTENNPHPWVICAFENTIGSETLLDLADASYGVEVPWWSHWRNLGQERYLEMKTLI